MKNARTISNKPQRGAALMAVLWLIAILAIASLTTLRVIKYDADIAAARIHGSRARQVAEMGIAIGSNPAVKRWDPLLKQMNAEKEEGYEVRVISEGGRFNINAILLQEDKALLKEIFIGWGLELDDAQTVADALGDWVDADDNAALNGAEKEEYEEAGRINQPFNRPFYNLSEMRLVRGMEFVESVKPNWREWFTVWSGGALDLNEASAELIAAAAECRVEQADAIPQQVRGIDGQKDTEDDEPFQNAAAALDLLGIDTEGRPDLNRRFTVNDTTTHIESIGQARGAKRKITVIVRNRDRNGNGGGGGGKLSLLERTEEIIP